MPYKDPAVRKAYAAQHRQDNIDQYKARSKSYRERAYETVNALKDNPCTDCGVKYPPYVMQFDHIEDNKFGSVANLIRSKGTKYVLDEIAKCELVCANCHAVRTWQRHQHN